MNSSKQIQYNETVTFLPRCDGVEIFRRLSNIVFVQLEKEIIIPIAMYDSLIFAINKAKGVNDEG
jgi:hypothetical protein